jgi:hypothetical protein
MYNIFDLNKSIVFDRAQPGLRQVIILGASGSVYMFKIPLILTKVLCIISLT